MVDLLTLGVRAFDRHGERFAVRGYGPDIDHGRFSALLVSGLDRVRVDPFQRDRIGVRVPGHRVVLAVVIAGVFPVDLFPGSRHTIEDGLHAVGTRWAEDDGAALRRRAGGW